MENINHKTLQHTNTNMIYKLQRLANIGWWRAYFDKQVFIFSDYICEVLKIESNTVSFEYFLSLIHPDHRERIIHSFFILQQFETYNETFPVLTPDGYLWIHTKAGQEDTDEEGTPYIFGYSEYLEESKFDIISRENSELQIKDLLSKHNSISKSLLNFLEKSNTDQVIIKILNNILQQFKGDRVYIFEYNWQAQTHSCIYEVTLEGVSAEISTLQNQPINMSPWWTEQLLQQKPIIINQLSDIPDTAGQTQEVLSRQNICSLMVTPLISREGVWGYMGVDIIKRKRVWNNLDYEWFSSLSNIISIFLELRKSNTALQSREERLRKIYQTIPVGIETYDKNGMLEDINEMGLEIFGIKDKKDAIGLNLYANPNVSPELKSEIRAGHDVNFQLTFNFLYTKNYFPSQFDGTKYLNVKGTPLRDAQNQIESYLMIIIDDTETLNAFNRIKEFEGFFSFIAEFAEIGLYQWNPIKKTGFGHKQWFKNLNETRTEINDVISEYSTVHPDDIVKFRNFYRDAIEGKTKSMQEDIRVKDNNDWKWIRCSLKVKEYDPENNNVEIIGVNINISELKKAESRLLEAKIRAEESDRLKSAFLANMSHEIRTPLNAIVGFSNILAETNDLQDKMQYLNIIQRNNDLLLQLISDILDLSKIEAGSFDIIYNETDVNALCWEIIHTQELKTNRQVHLVFENYQPQCVIYSDKNRITQVISNLVNNALKFTSQGSIKIGYTLSEKEISFYVQDTGIGIGADELPTIFDRFVKLNTFAKGTGLGLAICKSIIEKMEGRIGVNSEIGKGSRFWFTLPLKQCEDQFIADSDSTSISSSIPEAGTLPVILIAEDTESNFLLLKSILKHDYRIIWAHNGKEAVSMHQENAPVLILMDVRMPEMDGLTATKTIRATGSLTPVIALTAFAFDQDKQQALNAGCNDYMPKPVSSDQLKSMIRKYIER